MTSRERWTVYPLLLLAIGLGMFDKIVPGSTVEFNSVQCRQLTVVSHDRSKLATLTLSGTADDAGLITLYRQQPMEQVTGGRKTVPAMRLSADKGGSIEILGHHNSPRLILGHDAEEKLSGLMSRDTQGMVQDNGSAWGVHYPWPTDEGPAAESSVKEVQQQ